MIKKFKKYLFIIVILITPGFWSSATKTGELLKEWSYWPKYVQTNFSSYLRTEKLRTIEQMRWANVDTQPHTQIISKVFYNKLTLVGDQLTNFLDYFSPKQYFHSGNADFFSPHSVEPIPAALAPYFLWGLILLIKKKNYRPIILYLIFVAIAFAAGKNNFAYLLPILMTTVFIGCQGLKQSIEKRQYILLSITTLYFIFTFCRFLYYL